MNWIVIGTKGPEVILSSFGQTEGILPKGSYLTIEEQAKCKTKFILRVVDSSQNELFSPSPLIVEMDLTSLDSDTLCKNTVTAIRVKDFSTRTDGLVDVIKPTLKARRSNQEEINQALGENNGPKIFPATVFGSSNTKLIDNEGNNIYSSIPLDIYWHQIQITGKTGSGKTVASKYLAQHFVENKIPVNNSQEKKFGAVLAINVKDDDFLTMDRETSVLSDEIEKEWESLQLKKEGLQNVNIYYNASEASSINSLDINKTITKEISLDPKKIEPKSLFAIVQNLNDNQQQFLPDIFRYWQNKKTNNKDIYFSDFLDDFESQMRGSLFYLEDESNRESTLELHSGTSSAIHRKLKQANKYFKQRNNDNSVVLDIDDIMVEGKLSVLHVTSDPDFGSIILRDLLNKIMQAKNSGKTEYDLPILIIIDEIHQFYKSSNSRQALGDLDTICRVGRSKQIGVVFSTQNEEDLPKGISSVVNTKLYFKNDTLKNSSSYGVTKREVQSLKAGYGVGLIHGMPELSVFKFPMSICGVK